MTRIRGSGETKRNARTPGDPSPIIPRDGDIESPRKGIGGVPSTYKPEYVEKARKLTAIGATEKQIGDFFGVEVSTLLNWAYSHPEFYSAIKIGRGEFDDNITRSLARRALGYEYDSEKVFLTKDGEIVRVPITVHVPPETTAIIFWLTNRHPDEWKRNRDGPMFLPGRDGEAPTMRIIVENAPEATSGSGDGAAVTISDHRDS